VENCQSISFLPSNAPDELRLLLSSDTHFT
jgi:hypothetical protein